MGRFRAGPARFWSRKAVGILWISAAPFVWAAGENPPDPSGAVARAAIAQVRETARRTKSLEEFGRRTLEPAAAILDLGPEALPALLEAFRPETDWKVRFWIVDLLGYVGTPRTVAVLGSALRDEGERIEVRRKACQALQGILERHPDAAVPARRELRFALKTVREKDLRALCRGALKNLDLRRREGGKR